MIVETAEFSNSLLNLAFFVTLSIFTLPSIVSVAWVLKGWRDEDRALGRPVRPIPEIIHLPRRRKAA